MWTNVKFIFQKKLPLEAEEREGQLHREGNTIGGECCGQVCKPKEGTAANWGKLNELVLAAIRRSDTLCGKRRVVGPVMAQAGLARVAVAVSLGRYSSVIYSFKLSLTWFCARERSLLVFAMS